MRRLISILDALVFEHSADAPRVGTWRRLRGGPAHRSVLWRASTPGTRVIVKVHHSALADGSREAWALARLPADVGPQLVRRIEPHALEAHGGPRRAVIVMGDVGGLAAPDAPTPRVIGALARCVAHLHAARARHGPKPPLPDTLGALASTTMRWLEEATIRALVPRREAKAAERVITSRAARGLFEDPARRLVHGDLRWSNARFFGCEARLVDFEHAGLGDPALDLALFTWRAPLARDAEETFLDDYAAAARERRRALTASRTSLRAQGEAAMMALRARYDALLPLVAVACTLAERLDAADADPRTPRIRTDGALGATLDRLSRRA